MDVMANSLVYWTQDLFYAGLFSKGSRVFGMSSAGSIQTFPYYGVVSAAKAGSAIGVGIEHPAYCHQVDPVPGDVRVSLVQDLD